MVEAACGRCHLGGFANGGLALDAGPDALVDVPSRIGMVYVAAGDPGSSYLSHKLAGTHLDVGGFGARMPIGLPLDDAELDLVDGWITAGALP
ncbi:MAG: hypothetical protein ABMB14_20965 [Myxococcota bacterium]